eukprot:TRINITY_DN19554_c0_g1_i1.p1 TRINITY_DN19554_c0_g1~~TRINITY_DN19554_c0_g1_i1.p1  ORF type:complete len:252 (-),score=29.03 TRINITY_DN19554_c0_g1_i1:499-1254(-)
MSKMKPRTKLVAIHPVHGYAIPPPQDVKVSRRNARERNRVKSVNNGFEILKRHIPSAAPVKKMSKVNILSHAVDYIESLTALLKEAPNPNRSSPKPTTSYPTQACHSPYPQQPCYTQTSYPPPLTPISPNTLYYPPNQAHAYRHYESGYETSGFFSDSERPPQSHRLQHQSLPGHVQRSHSWGQELPPQDYTQYNRDSSLHGTVSPAPSSVSESSSSQYIRPKTTKTKTETHESSGEEDDILDAIAEWQQD